MPRTAARGGMGWETGEECPHEWGHGSLKGYATVHRRRGNELRMGCREKSNQFKTESAASVVLVSCLACEFQSSLIFSVSAGSPRDSSAKSHARRLRVRIRVSPLCGASVSFV